MRGNEAQLFLFHPGLKGHQVAGHLPNLLNGAAALDVKGVQNVLRLLPDGSLVGNIVRDGPHLFPVKLLGVQPHPVIQVGLVDVQVHHTGIGPADLGQVCVPKTAADLGGLAPVLNLRLHNGIAALHHAGDNSMALAGPLQVGHHLSHGAAGHVQIPHGGQHVVGGGVGQQLEDDQVHIGGAKLVSRLLGQLLGGDNTAVDQLHGIGNHGLKSLVLGLELRHQGRELGQISAQGNGEHTHTGFCFN